MLKIASHGVFGVFSSPPRIVIKCHPILEPFPGAPVNHAGMYQLAFRNASFTGVIFDLPSSQTKRILSVLFLASRLSDISTGSVTNCLRGIAKSLGCTYEMFSNFREARNPYHLPETVSPTPFPKAPTPSPTPVVQSVLCLF